MGFYIVHNDIVNMETDAIVNAANPYLEMGGGVCGAVFRAAGVKELQEECRKKAPCPTGKAVLTAGYGLKARHIIHVVGPVWKNGEAGEEKQLRMSYRSALKLAEDCGCQSVAFPLISSGLYGYPRREALKVAVEEFRRFLQEKEMEIYLVVMDQKVIVLSENLYGKIQHYIDTYYTGYTRSSDRRRDRDREMMYEAHADISRKEQSTFGESALPEEAEKVSVRKIKRSLEELLRGRGETFQEMLFRLIDERGFTDVQVYKRANMDRRLFSKIRSNKEYVPKKTTVLSLAVALELSLDETIDLLGKAGYSMTDHLKSDIILRYFLENQIYDIYEINEALFCFGESLLGL